MKSCTGLEPFSGDAIEFPALQIDIQIAELQDPNFLIRDRRMHRHGTPLEIEAFQDGQPQTFVMFIGHATQQVLLEARPEGLDGLVTNSIVLRITPSGACGHLDAFLPDCCCHARQVLLPLGKMRG